MTQHKIITVLVTLLVSGWGLANAQDTTITSTDVPQEHIVYMPSDGPQMEPLMEVDAADDADYFVLSIPPVAEQDEEKIDVVILCDTSASMNGDFRDASFGAIHQIVGALNPSDRVQIMACDTNAIPLTSTLAAPGDQAVTDAFTALQKRTPLGSVDVDNASVRNGLLRRNSTAGKVIVFVGQEPPREPHDG